MILLNAFVSDLLFEAVRFVFMAGVMVAGVFAGKCFRQWMDARKAKKEMETKQVSQAAKAE